MLGVWHGSPVLVVGWAMAACLGTRSWLVGALCVLAGLGGGLVGSRAWSQVTPRALGEFSGWVQVVNDPAPIGSGLRVTVEIEGERFDAWLFGATRHRVQGRQSGEWLQVKGERRALGAHARRSQVRHVVGRFEVEFIADWHVGSPLDRANTRVRSALQRAAEAVMPVDQAALFTGLVIGDDARQPEAMIQQFRISGMSHLTAVSGQNVAFVLAASAPLLRRLRPWWRFGASVGLIAWFMALTRFEPSVLRAGSMAILAASAFVGGRQRSPLRLLALAVTVLVFVDPLLVWSVGFWLSVCATAGVCVVGPWLTARLPGPSWWRAGLGVTLGAQVGVALPSWLVFHRFPLVSLPANLLAVPVAGLVMLYGIPAGLLAAALPTVPAALVMAPAVLGTRWVAAVAAVAARVEPSPGWAWFGWGAVALVTTAMVRRSRRSRSGMAI